MTGRSDKRAGRQTSVDERLAEQARIVALLVARVDVRIHGIEVKLRPTGLTGLVCEVLGSRRAAA